MAIPATFARLKNPAPLASQASEPGSPTTEGPSALRSHQQLFRDPATTRHLRTSHDLPGQHDGMLHPTGASTRISAASARVSTVPYPSNPSTPSPPRQTLFAECRACLIENKHNKSSSLLEGKGKRAPCPGRESTDKASKSRTRTRGNPDARGKERLAGAGRYRPSSKPGAAMMDAGFGGGLAALPRDWRGNDQPADPTDTVALQPVQLAILARMGRLSEEPPRLGARGGKW